MAMKYKIEELRDSLQKVISSREGMKITEDTLTKMNLTPEQKQCVARLHSEKLQAQIVKMNNINKKLSKIEDQLTTEISNIRRPEFSSPEFRHPLNFLEDLTDFLEQIPTEYHTVETVVDCFQGDAYSWAMIFKERWANIEDFKKDFLKQYWGHAEQSLLRRHIVCGVWDSERETMAEHFISLVDQSKLLTRPIADKDLFYDIICHFSKHVIYKWELFTRYEYFNRQPSTASVISFLQKLDIELPAKLKSTERPQVRQPTTSDNAVEDSDEDYDDTDDYVEPEMCFNGDQNLVKEIAKPLTGCTEKRESRSWYKNTTRNERSPSPKWWHYGL